MRSTEDTREKVDLCENSSRFALDANSPLQVPPSLFHHLSPEEKEQTLRAIRRVLKLGGEFHMLDFEGPGDTAHGFLAHLLHSSARLKDNSQGRVLSLFRQAGFANVKNVEHRSIRFGFGRVPYYSASVPKLCC
jgi:hypothetical protein